MGKGFVGIALAASVLAGCGTIELSMPDGIDPVEAQSYKGVDKALNQQVLFEFQGLDKDRNKFIDPAEFGVATPQSFVEFARQDSNNDGKITLNEMQPGFFTKVRGTFALRKASRFLFDNLDRNRDGFLTQFEVQRSPHPELAVRFAKFARHNPRLKEKTVDNAAFDDLYANAMLVGQPPAPPPQDPPPADPGTPPADPGTPPADPASPTP